MHKNTTLNNKNHNSKKRRFGEFFTPIMFAKKSLEYIKKSMGDNFLDNENLRIWDSSGGTGNLIYSIDKKYHNKIYLSTLYEYDVKEAKKLYPEANIFQYDYLNDDVESLFVYSKYKKLPKQLVDDLNNKDIVWLIYINPPYATSQSAGANSNSKKNVSTTKTREYMHSDNLGEVSRELYTQFLYRINYEFKDKNVYLAVFSKINYINSNNNEKFRDKIFNYKFVDGFLFSSTCFDDTSKVYPFPISFAMWNMNNKLSLQSQNIIFDVLDDNGEKLYSKKIVSLNKSMLLNNWIKRYRNVNTMPPLSSAIKVKNFGDDIRDKVASGFLFSLMSCGNDIQKQNLTAILSSPQASAGSMSITVDNFEKAIIIFAVRRATKTNWLNSSEQFKRPDKEKECLEDKEFLMDCLIYSLFSNSNQGASIRNVEYKGVIYNIKNNLFPLLISEVKTFNIKSKIILDTIKNDTDRFVALYLNKNRDYISSEANSLLCECKELYRLFFETLDCIDKNILKELKIEYWDLGFFQIRNAINMSDNTNAKNTLKKLKIAREKIVAKIEDKIKYYNFV